MPLYDKRIQFFYKLLDCFFSVVRLIKKTTFKETYRYRRNSDKLIVMGNGPSLLPTLESHKDKLEQYDLMAVNFMGLSSSYLLYKPNLYVLLDPAFWQKTSTGKVEEKVLALYQEICKNTSWDLSMYLPYQSAKTKEIESILCQNPLIHIFYYNNTKFEGFSKLNDWIYGKQWGMPRAQNVLNAALMLGIYFQYSQIVLAGADNDWISNLWVDEQNNVRINDTHFYDYDEAKKNARYFNMTMDESLLCFYFAFRTYNDINAFAAKNGVEIVNANPQSYIDAFKKDFVW